MKKQSFQIYRFSLKISKLCEGFNKRNGFHVNIQFIWLLTSFYFHLLFNMKTKKRILFSLCTNLLPIFHQCAIIELTAYHIAAHHTPKHYEIRQSSHLNVRRGVLNSNPSNANIRIRLCIRPTYGNIVQVL